MGRTTERHLERAAYSVAEFVEAYRIGRRTLYDLWRRGEGPRFKRVGDRRIIPVEAAREWAAK